MSLLASSLAGANYMTTNNEDRESATNGAAEFTRRKKWPEILLKELVGGSIFCLKPIMIRKESGPQSTTTWNWKIIYSSPAVGEMLGQKPAELEGKDFLDLVFAADHSQIQTFFHHLLTPSLPHHGSSSSTSITTSSNSGPGANAGGSASSPTLGDSQTTYVRMLNSSINGSTDNSPDSSNDSSNTTNSNSNGTGNANASASANSKRGGPVVWELRAHASGLGDEIPISGTENFGTTQGGTVQQQPQGGENSAGNGMKGKAIWVMGRRVGENILAESSLLDAFLELKLENERLREELRELQLDLDEDMPSRKSSGPNISPTKQTAYVASSSASSSESSPSSSRSSSPSRAAGGASLTATGRPKGKTGRPPKEGKDRDKEKKRKKSSAGGINGKEGEGMHVCVTCGRTDSPEWRKGPLGPKTLCNACGLRWAKRNSNQPTRKDRKPNDGKK
uniref:White collar 2 protein n=1 Tax=Kwoniella dejecticola CBS 10117 TaxID=1296121 RepID=A0A1A5ZXU9_9TREE|nr:uncharacterized protein I303_07397 [Kwoniella dejecticola CBS 10117]OBR82635.1 hypothetical protein I303_07397 [Kwoniella dejecticola CBS 10117]